MATQDHKLWPPGGATATIILNSGREIVGELEAVLVTDDGIPVGVRLRGRVDGLRRIVRWDAIEDIEWALR